MKKLLWAVVLVGLAGIAHAQDHPTFSAWDKQFYTCIHEAHQKFSTPKCSAPEECKTLLVPVREQIKQYVNECMVSHGFGMKVEEKK